MLKTKEYSGKNEEEVLAKIEKDFTQDDIIIKEKQEEQSLLSNKMKYEIVVKEDLLAYLQAIIQEIGVLMDNEIESEIAIENNYIKIKFVAENNGLLIGKNGRTLHAFQVLIGQIVRREVGRQFRVAIDVGKYKEEKQKKLERDIRFIADDIVASKVGVKLDYMNSYERRVVHSVINEYEQLETKSEGEDPKRFINIIYREK